MHYRKNYNISIDWILAFIFFTIYTTLSMAQGQPSIAELNQQDSLIDALNSEGKYSEAMELTKQHWNTVQAMYQPTDTMYINAYTLLGIGYYNLRDYDKAVAVFEKNITFAKTVYSTNHIKYIKKVYNLAGVFNEQRKNKETLAYAAIIQELLEENNLTDKVIYADLQNLLGNVWKNKRDYNKAIGYYEKAIKGLDTNNKKEKRLAIYTANLARVYTAIAKYSKAEAVLKEAQNFIATEKGIYHNNYRKVIVELASLYTKQSQYDKAEKNYLQAMEIAKGTVGESHPVFASIWYQLAVMYFYEGDYQKCEAAFITNKKLTAKYRGTNSIDYAIAVGNLGALYWKLNRYEEAENLYLEGLSIAKKVSGDTSTQVASSLGNIGLLYSKQDKIILAEQYYLKSIAIYKALGMGEAPNSLQNINNLIGMYIDEKKNIATALALSKKVLQARKEQFGANHPQYAESMQNLGRCYELLHQYDQAEELYLKSIAIVAEKLGRHHIEYIKTKITLIDFFLKERNDIQKARVHLKEGLKANLYLNNIDIDNIDEHWGEQLLQKQQIVSPLLLRSTLIKLTKIIEAEQRENKLEQSYIIAEVLLKILDKNRQEYTTEQDKLRLLNATASYSHQALELGIELAKEEDKLFALTEKSKAVLLSNSIQSNKAQQFGAIPKDWQAKEQALQQALKGAKAKLQQQTTDSLKEQLYDEISSLNIQIDSFNQAIKKKYPKYYTLRNTTNETTINAIQQELSKKKAILSYMVGDSITYVMYIDKEEFRIVGLNIELNLLQQKIKTLRKSLSNYSFILKEKEAAANLYTSAANWFYEQLIQPIIDKKKTAIQQLVIIPDGELAHLPFEVFLKELPQQREGAEMAYKGLNYLMKDYSISYHYSAGLWLESEQSTLVPINNQMLAMAASYTADLKDTTKSNTYIYQLREGLSPIPAVQQEVNGLSQNFEGLFLTGLAANESKFKQEAKNYGIIHLAMHGILNQNYPLLSAMAMTESKDTLEDDLLEVHEIAGLDLQTGLIVLSACETGFGKFEQGNGVASLARSFMYAGANSMVVSLWQVNDQSTAYLMQQYYQLLAEGLSKDEALQKAKISYIDNVKNETMAHPAFWAPFVQLGNTQPIAIATKGGEYWRWLLGGAVVLLGGFFFWYKKRTALG